MHPILYVYARPRTFLLALALFLLPQTILAATLSLTPANVSVGVGDTFTLTVRVSSSDQAMNASSGTLSFPTDLLRVSSIAKGNSVLTLWVQDPSFSNTAGTIDWSGVVPNPGYSGSGGPVMTVTFVAKRAGTASVSFVSSAVLANDGNGTNILVNANPSSIAISSPSAPPAAPAPQNQQGSDLLLHITSSTHPDQTKWYNLSHAILDWTNAQDVTAVRLGYDKNADGVPTVVYTDPLSHKELDLNDGIWYFHVQEKNGGGWGPTATYRIQIDSVVPLPITIAFPNGATTATSSIAVQFATTDLLSGIDHYQLSVDGSSFNVSNADGAGVYALSSGDPGTHTLITTAYDKAGNSVAANAQFIFTGEKKPASPLWSALVWLIANYLSLILLILAALALIAYLAWYLWHHFHQFRRRFPGSPEHVRRVVHEQFNELQEAVLSEIRSLENVRSSRQLTREEAHLITALKAHIRRTEFKIENEMVELDKR